MEAEIAPDPPSPMSTASLSDYVSPIKVRLSPDKRKNVAKELEDALERAFFKKQWPHVEVPVSSKLKNKSAIVGKGRGKDRTREPMEESRVFQAEMMDEQKRRKEELMRLWKEKPERNIEDGEECKVGWRICRVWFLRCNNSILSSHAEMPLQERGDSRQTIESRVDYTLSVDTW